MVLCCRLMDEMKTELAKKEQDVEECKRQIADMRKEIEILNEEIAVLKESSSKTPTATMKNLVERLKNQLALKEKQHQVMSALVMFHFIIGRDLTLPLVLQ